MGYISQRTAPIREKRLGSLAAWYGTINNLIKEADETGLIQRIRTFAQDTPSDLILALELLSTLHDVAIVVHGPAGCAAGLHQSQNNNLHWAVTNISERDSILGGDAKLKATIRQVYQDHQPHAIIVVASPVVIINNDDIESVTEELRDELNIPLIPVFTDGFRSKIAATGYDVTVHALIKHLLPVEAEKTSSAINLLSFHENEINVAALIALLDELGLNAVSFPRHFDVKHAQQVANARLSIAISHDLADYTGEALTRAFSTDYLSLPTPIGIAATTSWLNKIAEATNLKDQAEKIIRQQIQSLESYLQNAANLQGRKVFIHLSPDEAISFWFLARELGLEVIGIKVPFLDPDHIAALREIATSNDALPILVGHGQAFEEIALLKSARPDLYISKSADALPATRLGITVLPVDNQLYHGFNGVKNLLLQIKKRLVNNQFQRFIAEGDNEPYSNNWLKKSAYWHIKHEVK